LEKQTTNQWKDIIRPKGGRTASVNLNGGGGEKVVKTKDGLGKDVSSIVGGAQWEGRRFKARLRKQGRRGQALVHYVGT